MRVPISNFKETLRHQWSDQPVEWLQCDALEHMVFYIYLPMLFGLLLPGHHITGIEYTGCAV